MEHGTLNLEPGTRNLKRRHRIMVIGHRGAAGIVPENTMAGFARALEIGVDALELDVHLSADGRLVVHHNPRLNPDIARDAQGRWIAPPGSPIRHLSLAEVKGFDVGRLKPGTSYAGRYPDQRPADGEKIPTLEEVIALLQNGKGAKTELWVEIKSNPMEPELYAPPDTLAAAVVDLIRREGMEGRCRIMSFDWRVLSRAQKIAPHIPAVFLSSPFDSAGAPEGNPLPKNAPIRPDRFNAAVLDAVARLGGRCWAPRFQPLSANRIRQARQAGISVFAWTPDSRADMESLMAKGVDGIITNRPDILMPLIGR